MVLFLIKTTEKKFLSFLKLFTISIYDYPSAELEPRKLGKKEIEDPYQVINSFFDYSHLPQVKEHLWEWLSLTVCGSYYRKPRIEKANVLYFYEKIELSIEAVHILHKRQATEQA
jgi:hypothetical protein